MNANTCRFTPSRLAIKSQLSTRHRFAPTFVITENTPYMTEASYRWSTAGEENYGMGI